MTVLNKDKILDAAKEYVSQGKFDKAIKEYDKLLAVDPADMRVKIRIAELYIKKRQIKEAIAAYRFVADAYTREGFYLKAVTLYKSILRLNPSLVEINAALGDLYEKMGIKKDAVHQYEILVNAYETQGNFADSLRLKEKLVELIPDKPLYRIRLAEGYQRESRHDEAIIQFELLARQYREKGEDAKKLIDLYEKILPHRKENKEMFKELVSLYYKRKEYPQALKWLEERKNLVAVDGDLMLMQAQMYAGLNQLESARNKYQELAEMYTEKGQTSRALEAYAGILAILPEESENVKQQVEAIQGGSFDGLFKRVEEERKKEEEAARQKELQEEAQKAEQENAKTAAKAGPAPVPAPPEAPRAEAPAKGGEAPKPKIPPGGGPTELIGWLKKARSALALGHAYRDTGLVEEAKKEFETAAQCLEKVLEIDSEHPEALQLKKTLS